jgi:class 3 adenylate cyclase
MAENVGRTLICSVLFLDIVGYSKESVDDQHRLKRKFNEVIAHAMEGVAQRDRVILDTGDGAAVTFFGDPERVLQVAVAIRDGVDMPVRSGINLGPVRLITDLNGQVNIIGDGINVAQRVMSFCPAGELLVSRSFYEIAATLSSAHAAMFKHAGAHKDKHVRAHEVYTVVRNTPAKGSTAAPVSEELAKLPAEIFDAGEHLIVSAYTREAVQEELDRLSKMGARVLSEISEIGNRWLASCARPDSPTLSRVEQFGGMRVVTGPTREVVASKVKRLLEAGATVVSEAECINGVWTAVCEEHAG